MEKQQRDFYQRSQEDQASFLEQTWCNKCQKVDLGMTSPEEYEIDGKVSIDGKCSKCGDTVTTEIFDEDEDWEE
jgi:endogenous inhibitor of DNA gyrase (YacG/DUF329 family)